MKILLTISAFFLGTGLCLAQQQQQKQKTEAAQPGLYTNIHTPPVRREAITIRKPTDANSTVNPEAKPGNLQIKKESSAAKSSSGPANPKQ